MVEKVENFRGQPATEAYIAYEDIRVCTMCNKNIKKANLHAYKIDGLWLCGYVCIYKFLKEKKRWTPMEWAELCKMQAVHGKRKGAMINTIYK